MAEGTTQITESYVEELKGKAATGDDKARAELQFIYSQLASGQGEFITGSSDPAVWAHLTALVEEGLAEASGSSAYTPYHEISEDEILQRAIADDPMLMHFRGGLTAADRQRYRDMLAEERYAKFKEDWAYIMSGGDPTGIDGFTPIGQLEGQVNEVTSVFEGGFDQFDNRFGDVRNQRGLLPGQTLDAAQHRASELDSAGTRLGWILEDMTKREARGLMLSLAPHELAGLQRAMDDAGLYQSAPTFGLLSSDDFAALDTLAGLSDLTSGQKSMTTLLTELQRTNMGNIAARTGMAPDEISNRVISLTSSEALRQMGEEIGLSEMGRRPSDEVMNRAIAAVHAAERQYGAARADADDINSGLRNPERERFIDSLGGLRGFHGGNWAHWSTQVFGAVVEQTPANREVVAHAMTQHYFDRYGDWGMVAQAIFHGPERGAFNLENNLLAARFGNNPIQQAEARASGATNQPITAEEYSQAAMQAMAEANAAYLTEANTTGSGLTFVEAPNAQAILNREMRAADEVGYQSWQFADAAANYYRLLGATY